ncbi:unnamed protein product, partial [Brenthis ino]
MLLCLLWFGMVLSAPTDELHSVINEGELTRSDDVSYMKYIIPSGYSPQKFQKSSKRHLADFVSKDNEYYQILHQHLEDGHIMKGLTFSIYDDNMREATIALFRLLQYSDDDKVNAIKEWASHNINSDVVDYAFRLVSLFRDNLSQGQVPPFMSKPNYFVNAEAITKALKLKINNGKFDVQEAQIQQFYRTDDKITINANYSGWHRWNDECKDHLDYFREDIGVNSYYYGMHLLYPFWMNKDELTGIDPKYADQYYFIHQQLMARYNLEKEHLKHFNKSADTNCYDDFIPYLTYDNGLPFSSRSSVHREWNEEYARIKSIDIAIKECITRGVIFMDNGTKVTLTEENYVDLIAKLIRANYESNQTAKIIRSLYGYGGSGYPINRYNPAPSVLHHPQTTLRDPMYWYMIQNLLKYFTDYSSSLQPFDFSKYQTEEFNILDNSFTKITTYFEFYEFNIEKLFQKDTNDHKMTPLSFSVRQKRLKHLPFTLSFTVHSQVNKTVVVKLFLGPHCEVSNCWNEFSNFFELDSFTQKLEEELNVIKWAPELSTRYSFDDHYNLEHLSLREKKYDMFKFPENMIIPKGLEQGLNLTLFVLITPISDTDDPSLSVYSSEPFGFPFHRQAFVNNSTNFNNYKFWNITIFHKENSNERNGYFSPHLN